jgi:hypothetical protein
LRSLEEFRKNPHVKIPPKSPSTNFQSLGKFKNPIFIRKEFFLIIWPTRASLARAGPLRTAGHRARAWPIPACAALAYLPKAVSSSSLRLAAIDRPAPPGLHHCDANQSPLLPRLDSPLTPSPPINGVGRKSPAPIKGEHHPRVGPHLSPLLFPSLHA